MPVRLFVDPHCTLNGAFMDWYIVLPTDGRVPDTALYGVENWYPNGTIAATIEAPKGYSMQVKRTAPEAGWRLDIFGPDGNWHPITDWTTEAPPACFLA